MGIFGRLPFDGEGYSVNLSELLGLGNRRPPRDGFTDACVNTALTLDRQLFNRNDYSDAIRAKLDMWADLLVDTSKFADVITGNLDDRDELSSLMYRMAVHSDEWLSLIPEHEVVAEMTIFERISLVTTTIVFAMNHINHGVVSDDAEVIAWVAGRSDYEVRPCACEVHRREDEATT